jgi:putative transposase
MIAPGDLRAEFPQAPGRHPLEAVDQLRQRDLRWILHQKVDMIVFPVALDQPSLEVAADLGEDRPQVPYRRSGQDVSSVFGDKDQMNMKCENTMPTCAVFHVDFPETNSYLDGMNQMRGYVYRLAPTSGQEAVFRSWAGACRVIYNIALAQRREWGRRYREREGRSLTGIAQQRDLKVLRAEYDWMAAVPQECMVAAIDDLDMAFDAFFKGRAAYPKPARRGGRDRFRFKRPGGIAVRRINRRWSEVKLPKIGWVRFRDTRAMIGEIRNATVSLTPLGWQISIMCMAEVEVPDRLSGSVGIDRGVAVPVMLSTGEAFVLPVSLLKLEKQHRRAQRVVARRRRGSARHGKAMRRAAAIKSRAARVRLHWQHEVTSSIARRFGVVVIEKLKTKSMTKSAKGTMDDPGKNVAAKAGLNRSILNVGWHGIEVKLAYKLAAAGGDLVRVNPAFTSQTCSCCGVVDKRGRESQASFVCPSCGFRGNADLNAAINIERRGNTPLLDVEGAGCSPGEASTHRVAA